jgi:hypothetical protein
MPLEQQFAAFDHLFFEVFHIPDLKISRTTPGA